jgi:glycosyltransferase involved in cell wall biosynthesis
MNKEPLVSVIVNCYNGEKYLNEALDSIYAQTYENWEIIFFDNKSTDGSAKIANEYDDRLQYVYNEINVPLGEARKQALTYATGDWICFLDVDDSWYKGKLEFQVREIQSRPDIDVIYCGIEEISSDGTQIRLDIPRRNGYVTIEDLLIDYDLNIVTPMIKMEFLLKNQLSFDSRIHASEEYNLFMRIAVKGKIFASQNIQGRYRVYENSLTNKSIDKWYTERMQTLSQCISMDEELLNRSALHIRAAINRALYYKSRFLFSIGEYRESRQCMNVIKFDSVYYFLLFISSFNASVWNFIHRKNVKLILTKLLKINRAT